VARLVSRAEIGFTRGGPKTGPRTHTHEPALIGA